MKVINKFLVAIMLLTLLGMSFALAPAAFAMDEEEPEEVVEAVEGDEVGTVVDDLGQYNVADILVAMKDADVLITRMSGVLDRYDGTGHPDDCDDFVNYYTYLSLYNEAFDIEMLFAPADYQDVLQISVNGTGKGLASTQAIAFQCQNGRDDSISSFNLAAARAGLDAAHELMVSALHSTAARVGADPETVPSSIADVIDVDLTAEELDFIAELLGLEWDEQVFREDLLITSELLNNLGGWLDRLINGETVGCGEYFIYMLLLTEPVIFVNPPDVWQPLFQEHLAIINSTIDSNQELIDICLNDGGAPNEFIVFKARAGVAQAQDRLHRLKQTTDLRFGVTVE